MNNLGVWKRLALLAMVLMLPLWLVIYGMTIFGDMYVVSGLFPFFTLFAPPVIIALLLIGGLAKDPKLALPACKAGVAITAVLLLLAIWNGHVINNSHVMPYQGLRAEDLSAAAVYVGDGEWQDLSAKDTKKLVKLLQDVDYYKEWQVEQADTIPTDNPEWHFRLTYPNGYQERISLGHEVTYTFPGEEEEHTGFWGRYYIFDDGGREPALYQSRPYDTWDGDCQNAKLHDLYEDLLLELLPQE